MTDEALVAVAVPVSGAVIAWAWRIARLMSRMAFEFNRDNPHSLVARTNQHSDRIDKLEDAVELVQILEYEPDLLAELSRVLNAASKVARRHLAEDEGRNGA